MESTMRPRPSTPPHPRGVRHETSALPDSDEGAMDAIRRELDRDFPHWAGVPDSPPPAAVVVHGVERAGQRWIAVGALLLAFVGGGAAGIVLGAGYLTEPVASAPPAPVAPLPGSSSLTLSPLPPLPKRAVPAPPPRPQNPSAPDRAAAGAPRAGGAAAMAPAVPPAPPIEREALAHDDATAPPLRTAPGPTPEAP
jgi:hypothetical protein